MAAASSSPPQGLIDESTLMGWEVIDSGGFGQVSKVRHKGWCFDVAVKLLHYDDGRGPDLLREVQLMRQGSSPYVIQVLGVFRARRPPCQSAQLGLVMELMERGSLASLQRSLCERPPWPLVCRLAHQVALGINFLHSLTPPLLHLDLKPNNVLLDPFLNAKLTDFGLAKNYHSSSWGSRTDRNKGGTTSYMPPEAFGLQYKPAKASDIYSYGILLWSILAWKEPYKGVFSSLLCLKIPQGQRPPLGELGNRSASPEELAGLTNLMQRCWDMEPSRRPPSLKCATEAEAMFIRHKHRIVDVVHRVLKEMDSKRPPQQCHHHGDLANEANGINVHTGRPPVQEEAGGWQGNQKDVCGLKGPTQPSYASDTDSAPDHVDPSSNDPPRSRPSAPGRAEESLQQAKSPAEPRARSAVDAPAAAWQRPSNPNTPPRQVAPGLERQVSSPDPRPPANLTLDGGLTFNESVVTGVQQGNNNVMSINVVQRRRHPTGPFSVSSRQRGGNRKTPGNPGS